MHNVQGFWHVELDIKCHALNFACLRVMEICLSLFVQGTKETTPWNCSDWFAELPKHPLQSSVFPMDQTPMHMSVETILQNL